MTRNRQPDDIFRQILCKFIINLPKAELAPQRIWFHYQEAHYYYVDHVRNKQIPSHQLTENQKCEQQEFFKKLISLAPNSFKVDAADIISSISLCYSSIPVYGAILINQNKTKVLCVQNTTKQFGFPKGKVDEGQTPVTCAIREVWEEIGFDIGGHINQNEFIRIDVEGKEVILFIVKNIKEQSVKFKTLSKTEIRRIQWVGLDELWHFKTTELCRDAHKELLAFLAKDAKAPKSFYDIFLQNFKVEIKKNITPPTSNPFTNFKLDRTKLMEIFK